MDFTGLIGLILVLILVAAGMFSLGFGAGSYLWRPLYKQASAMEDEYYKKYIRATDAWFFYKWGWIPKTSRYADLEDNEEFWHNIVYNVNDAELRKKLAGEGAEANGHI